MYNTGYGYIQIILFIAFLIPAILFLLTQYRTLEAIQVINRRISPGQVWLQLIPLFGLVWQFIVVSRIADSIRDEFASWTNDSILELPDSDVAGLIRERPTYAIGMCYCVLICCGLIPLLGGLASLAGIICWIIYWIQLAGYKNMIQRKTA